MKQHDIVYSSQRFYITMLKIVIRMIAWKLKYIVVHLDKQNSTFCCLFCDLSVLSNKLLFQSLIVFIL